METDPDRTYEHEKRAAVTRRTLVTSSEHGRTDVERKTDLDISHTIFFRCLGNKEIRFNNVVGRKAKKSLVI